MSQETTRGDHMHCDPEELALAALGERTDIDTEHLAACDTCQADLASLRRVVRITRSGDAGAITSPAPRVWEEISTEIDAELDAEIDADAKAEANADRQQGARTPVSAGQQSPIADSSTTHHGSPGSDDTGVVVPLRRRSAPWLAAAAAVGVLFGAIGGVVWTQGSSTEPTVVAQASLEPLPGFPSRGVARVQSTDVGDSVTVDLQGLPATEGYYEVWLLTEDASAMVSLGAVGPGETSTLPLPPGIALDRFHIVDISAEEFDGDPTHSTVSVARGDLKA
jgi:hypothetical protein